MRVRALASVAVRAMSVLWLSSQNRFCGVLTRGHAIHLFCSLIQVQLGGGAWACQLYELARLCGMQTRVCARADSGRASALPQPPQLPAGQPRRPAQPCHAGSPPCRRRRRCRPLATCLHLAAGGLRRGPAEDLRAETTTRVGGMQPPFGSAEGVQARRPRARLRVLCVPASAAWFWLAYLFPPEALLLPLFSVLKICIPAACPLWQQRLARVALRQGPVHADHHGAEGVPCPYRPMQSARWAPSNTFVWWEDISVDRCNTNFTCFLMAAHL